MLIVARFVQGIGGAFSSSVIVAIIVTEFPSPLERAKAMSAYVFVAVGGGSVGLLAGGVLTQVLDWHWIFFVNVPIGIATLAAGYFLLVDNVGLGIKQGIDWLGSILVTVSVMVIIYAIVTAATDGWVSAHTLGIGGVGHRAVRGLPRPRVEDREADHAAAHPEAAHAHRFGRHPRPAHHRDVLDLLHRCPLLRARARLQPDQDGPGLPAPGRGDGGDVDRAHGQAGRPLRQQAGDVPGHGPGRRRPVALRLSRPARPAYFPKIFIAFLMLGLGAGVSFMPLLQIGMSEVPNVDAGLGSGVVNVSQQLAGAVGLAALSTIAANSSKSLLAAGHSTISALTHGYQLALLIAACSVALGLIVSPFLLRTDESAEEQATHIRENMANPESKEHLII